MTRFDWQILEAGDPEAADDAVQRLLHAPDGCPPPIDVLNRLVAHPGHRSHQAVVRAIQRAGDPSSVPCLRDALRRGLSMYDYTCSEPEVIAKWFGWALHDIGGAAAHAVVTAFASHPDRGIADEMRYRLGRWTSAR